MNINFSRQTGHGIKIAIIDSGCSTRQNSLNIDSGINLCKDSNKVDFTDNIGHGTACAGIICKKASKAELVPVKIFESELVTDIETLIKAIEWCRGNGINIINLSLGTTNCDGIERLEKTCKHAKDDNILIVAANANNGEKGYPASFPSVLGVNGGIVRGTYDYYFDPQKSIQFIARGDRQRLLWKDGQKIFLGGTSFAAPHITAIISLILEAHPGISSNDLTKILIKNSLQHAPEWVDGSKIYNIPSATPLYKSNKKLSQINIQNDINWIKKAAIFPYNKEMHSLLRYKDMLSFEISHVADVVGKRTIGKDCGEIIGADHLGIQVSKRLDESLNDFDTIILGYLDEISRIKKRDMLEQMLNFALETDINVYSLSPVHPEHYGEIIKKFNKKNLHIGSPLVTFAQFKEITSAFDWRTSSRKPVVGVLGTSPKQGKFTAQLALRKTLMEEGYKVGQLGTEHQSALFGFDFTFPNGYDGHQNIQIPMDYHITFLHSVMAGIENDNPHIIIVGGQSGIIPYSYAEKSQAYTLSSILLLMGTIPDAYILVVNSIDELDFIQENINVLKGLGKGKTIALVFSDKNKEIKEHLGRTTVTERPLSQEEIKALINKLENRFNIPATEIISNTGREKILKAVEDYFKA